MLAASWPGEKIDRHIATKCFVCHPERVPHGSPPPLPSRRARSSAAAPRLAELYRAHTEPIRRHLQRFGARDHDLDDLVQEVFLVLHAKRELLASVKPLEPWLREVCRRVAASDRRRAHRRREVAYGEQLETLEQASGLDAAFEQEERELRLHHALAELDDYSRDLVALHELGDLPLADMAELVEADRKTVRKRLGTALRRLSLLLGSKHWRGASPAAALPADADAPPRIGLPFRVLARHPDVNVGLVGSVLIAHWPGPATLEALELVDQQIDRAAELCDGCCAFLAIVESTSRPPDLASRRKLVAMLGDPRRRLGVYAAALEGGGAWLARPIMTGLSFLARPRFAMQYFEGLEAATRWLVQSHAELTLTSQAELLECARRLRSKPASRV